MNVKVYGMGIRNASVMLVACMATLALGSDPTVTFETPGERVSELMRQLGPLVGMQLIATPSVENEVVVGGGVLGLARLHLTSGTQGRVQVIDNPNGPSLIAPNQFAQFLVRRSRTPNAEPLKYLYSDESVLSFTIDFTETMHYGPATLFQATSRPDKAVTYDELPADFRAQVDPLMDRFRRFNFGHTPTPPLKTPPP